MKRLLDRFEKNKLAFWIAFVYVGLGTLSVCSLYTADYFYGDWSLYVLLITFPVSIISFGFRFAEADIIYPVFIIQFVMFILTFYILSLLIKKKS